MPRSTPTQHPATSSIPPTLREDHIEYGFIGTLQKLKYEYRPDIRDRATLEANFREKFESLNRVRLTDAEFARLLDEITTPDVFTASKTKGKRQNQLKPAHIKKIIDTYQHRKEESRYSRRVEMAEIERNDFNLNISRYISTAVAEAEIDLRANQKELTKIERTIREATIRHNAFLKELGLPLLP